MPRTSMPASKDLQGLRQQVQLPGFRNGPAPDHRQRPGREAVRDADDVVNGTYPLAIDDCDLYPIAKPEFDETDLVRPKPYTFSFTVTVKPNRDLRTSPSRSSCPRLTDAEIGSRSTPCARHCSVEDASAATKVKEDSYIDLAMRPPTTRARIPSLTTESRPTAGANLFPAGFDEQLVG
ncbi:MAG: trigger factor family protein [Eggerthellaceae bacterium]